MSTCDALFASALAASLLTGAAHAQQKSGPGTLTDQDRAQIRQLSDAYGRALGLCTAEEYAGLFAAPDGYFASGPRGRVAGRDRLMALVRSERHCNDNSERRPRNLPTNIVIEPSPEGATGAAPLG